MNTCALESNVSKITIPPNFVTNASNSTCKPSVRNSEDLSPTPKNQRLSTNFEDEYQEMEGRKRFQKEGTVGFQKLMCF